MNKRNIKKRAIVFVIDACGVGSLEDYRDFDELQPSNTLASVINYCSINNYAINIPTLQKLGLANITELNGLTKCESPIGSFGKAAEFNRAKDTITGHWEMMGVIAQNPFPYYPDGFPPHIVEKLCSAFGVDGILANCTASGTEVINEFGDEHIQTGKPIIYTSADSVLQIACHIDVVDLDIQYKWCSLAREIMRGEDEVARIIARPFMTDESISDSSKKYIRLNDKRHDYSVIPHTRSYLDLFSEQKKLSLGYGKIQDIFAGIGIKHNLHTKDNADGLDKLIDVLDRDAYIYLSEQYELENTLGSQYDLDILKADLCSLDSDCDEFHFINLVETDCNYGHRRDPLGFAKALEYIDLKLTELINVLNEHDLLVITADHGCDPCADGSDHTREYVPLLVYNKSIDKGSDLLTRSSFADVGATVASWINIQDCNEIALKGESLI